MEFLVKLGTIFIFLLAKIVVYNVNESTTPVYLRMKWL